MPVDYAPLPEKGDALDIGAARRLVETYLEAWNSHDPERLLACVTKDVRWQDPYLPEGLAQGYDAIPAWLLAMWQQAPELTFGMVDASTFRPTAQKWRCRGGSSPVRRRW